MGKSTVLMHLKEPLKAIYYMRDQTRKQAFLKGAGEQTPRLASSEIRATIDCGTAVFCPKSDITLHNPRAMRAPRWGQWSGPRFESQLRPRGATVGGAKGEVQQQLPLPLRHVGGHNLSASIKQVASCPLAIKTNHLLNHWPPPGSSWFHFLILFHHFWKKVARNKEVEWV